MYFLDSCTNYMVLTMQQPEVSVGILSDKEIKIVFYGNFITSDTYQYFNGKYTAYIENDKIILDNGKDKTKLDNNTILVPDDFESNSFVLRDVIIGKRFHWEKKENQRFLGSLKFIIDKGLLTTVNILPVEHYLTSVISSEMSATSPPELLKAHAIISRSWLLAQIEKSEQFKAKDAAYKSEILSETELIKWYDREDHTLYDVCADDHCQRYQGITKLTAHNAQDAIKDTVGLVLMYNNKLCDTRFSKSCGGISEAFENVWEPEPKPYLTKIIDYKFEPDGYDLDLKKETAAEKWIRNSPPAFCNTTDRKILSTVLLEYDQETTDFYRWKVEYTQNEIAELINTKSDFDFGNIIDLIPIERGESGRIIKLKIIGSDKTLTVGKELYVRKILSDTHLYSSAFVVDRENIVDGIPQRFILTGAGWGHGVGLCQIGAAVMSEMGYKFDEILLHYFKSANIKKIY